MANNRTNGLIRAKKALHWSLVMESREEQDNLVELSPELVAMLDKRQREWGTSSRGEVVEMLLGWMKKKTA